MTLARKPPPEAIILMVCVIAMVVCLCGAAICEGQDIASADAGGNDDGRESNSARTGSGLDRQATKVERAGIRGGDGGRGEGVPGVSGEVGGGVFKGAHGPLDQSESGRVAQLWAARVCRAEATWREVDCIAILDTITNRWRSIAPGSTYRDPVTRVRRPWRWLDMLREYSSVATPRRGLWLTQTQLTIRAYPWGDIAGKPPHINRRWARLRQVVAMWFAGDRVQPWCEAIHWGGLRIERDRLRANRAVLEGRWERIKCGDTVNTFFKRARR